MNILAVHFGHNATVALVQAGTLVFAMSEERFNRLKNSNGMPVMALDYVYKNLIKPEQIDYAVVTQTDLAGYLDIKKRGFGSFRNYDSSNVNFGRRYNFVKHFLSKVPGFFAVRSWIGRRLFWLKQKLNTKKAWDYYAESIKLPKEKILACNHHAAHAYSCCFNLDPKRKTLIFTMDGEGDGLSSTVNIYENYKLDTVSKNPTRVSLGYFFTEVTKLLGMIPNEHEFKVMGLAPYAKQEKARKLYEQHKDLIWLNENLEFESKIDTRRLEYYLLEHLYNQRFDTIAAFAQIFLEEKVLEWVRAWTKKTGIRHLALSGGVFMSVKLNQKILELPEVESLFVMPSGADESTPIGAACYGLLTKSSGKPVALNPISHLYLGKEYSDEEIEAFLKAKGCFEKYQIQKFAQEFELEKKAAQLLAENHVVARFSGRSEFGARALGHRSILANPSSRDTVRVINEMIKNRDFWMPFASSILAEEASNYLEIPKSMEAPYMAITFNTTELAKEHLSAAIHPYDFTCRPQLVYKDWEPGYHALISEFKRITGIGGILNTSFNLHGEPNVETPEDAVRTLENSGLKYLCLGKFLIAKR